MSGAPGSAGLLFCDGAQDSPMLRQELASRADGCEKLRTRTHALRAAAKRYRDSLSEASAAQRAFSANLDGFVCNEDDELTASALGDLAETLRSIAHQQEVLQGRVDALFVRGLSGLETQQLEEVRSLKRSFERKTSAYDHATARSLALVADTKREVLAAAEDEQRTAHAEFESSLLALVSGLQAAHTARRCDFAEAGARCVQAVHEFARGALAVSEAAAQRGDATLRTTGLERAEAAAHGVAPQRRIWEAGMGSGGEDEGGMSDEGPRSTRADAAPLSGPAFGLAQTERSRAAQATMAQARADGADSAPTVLKQGYLLKLSSNLMGDWKRRFFVLDSRGVLSYFTDAESARQKLTRLRLGGPSSTPAQQPKATVPLLTATVKRDACEGAPQLRFCFRLVSPLRTLTLQAESAGEQAEWVEAVSGAIAELLSTHSLGGGGEEEEVWDEEEAGGLSPPVSSRSSLSAAAATARLQQLPGNDACCDCGAPLPEWASLNLTALLCLRCSGAHRSLGVGHSKVRSLMLDVRVWEDDATMAAFTAGGNARVNSVLEALPGAAEARPTQASPPDAVAAFVQNKYVQRTWCLPDAIRRAPRRLQKAANGEGSGGGMGGDALGALLAGAPASAPALGPPSAELPAAGARTVLHAACEGGRLAICELLLQWGAPVSPRDEQGSTPILLAALSSADVDGAAEAARLLLRRGASEQLAEAATEARRGDARLASQLHRAATAAASAAAASAEAPLVTAVPSSAGHRRGGSGDVGAFLSALVPGRLFRGTSLDAPPSRSPPPLDLRRLKSTERI